MFPSSVQYLMEPPLPSSVLVGTRVRGSLFLSTAVYNHGSESLVCLMVVQVRGLVGSKQCFSGIFQTKISVIFKVKNNDSQTR